MAECVVCGESFDRHPDDPPTCSQECFRSWGEDDVPTCSECGGVGRHGLDSEGRCRQCSPWWPKREPDGGVR